MNRSLTGRKSQSGVMLLEAMIGILIFSMGVLALVGMQALATKVATESRERAEASNLASQLIGEMWLNRANLATNYNYVAGSGSIPSALSSWVDQVQSALPNVSRATGTNLPSVEVVAPTLPGVAGNQVVVTVRWMSPGASSSRRFQMAAYIN